MLKAIGIACLLTIYLSTGWVGRNAGCVAVEILTQQACKYYIVFRDECQEKINKQDFRRKRASEVNNHKGFTEIS